MKIAHAVSTMLCFVAAGCANLSTVERTTTLPHDGVAVHLDAPQRVTVANKKGWVCSEPSPDALQAYASSLGASLTGPSDKAVSIAQALSANAGSIGLRTQSITLMRDALYRVCELYFNGAISREAAVQLLQRSQDLTLGVLAIEQLTGAVVAQQMIMTSNNAATAAASINDTTKQLDRAKADEASKKGDLDAAQKAQDDQTAAVAAKKEASDAANAKAAGTIKFIKDLMPNYTKAKSEVAAAQEELDAAATQVKVLGVSAAQVGGEISRLEAQLKELQTKTEAAQKAYDDAKKAKKPKDELDKMKAALDAAKADEKKAAESLQESKDELVAINAQLKEQQGKQAAADKRLAGANKAFAPLKARMDAAKADPDQVAADKAAADLASANGDLATKTAATEAAKTAYADAQGATKEIQKLGQAIRADAGANTNSSGQFSTSTARYGVSKDTVEALSKATTDIIETVLNKGHMTDTCGVILMSNTSKVDPGLLSLCTQVIVETLQIWKEDARSRIACSGADCGTITPYVARKTSSAPTTPIPGLKTFRTEPLK